MEDEMADAVVLLGCGDVGPIHEPMERYSELVRGALQSADIRFAQAWRKPAVRPARARPQLAALRIGPFDAASWQAIARPEFSLRSSVGRFRLAMPRLFWVVAHCCGKSRSVLTRGAASKRAIARRKINDPVRSTRCSLRTPR
jgi:hypothetical protein